MDTMELVKAQEQEMIQMRRHIHQNPELSNQEFQTTKLIQEKLIEYGVEIADIGLKTGVVGVLKGRFPGKTLAIREDIDALPMKELTGLRVGLRRRLPFLRPRYPHHRFALYRENPLRP